MPSLETASAPRLELTAGARAVVVDGAGVPAPVVALLRDEIERRATLRGAGQLEEAADFYNAGQILKYGSDKDSLLIAHIMATTAGILEHKKARALYQETMDRYMIGLGHSPIFSDEVPEGVELAPRPAILELHKRVRTRIARGAR